MTEKAFASTGDLSDKTVSFTEIGPDLYAYTAEGDPNSGIIVGDDGCMVIDAQATPMMAEDVIARVRTVTDKPIKYVVLSHYHAVRVLGACVRLAEGLDRSHTQAVTAVRVHLSDDLLTVKLTSSTDIDLELWAAARHATALGSALGTGIAFEPTAGATRRTGLQEAVPHARDVRPAAPVSRTAVRRRGH